MCYPGSLYFVIMGELLAVFHQDNGVTRNDAFGHNEVMCADVSVSIPFDAA